jgi:hypothetical protein
MPTGPRAHNYAHISSFRATMRDAGLSVDGPPIPASAPSRDLYDEIHAQEVDYENDRHMAKARSLDVVYYSTFDADDFALCTLESEDAQIARIVVYKIFCRVLKHYPDYIAHLPYGDNYRIHKLIIKSFTHVSFAQREVASYELKRIFWRGDEAFANYTSRWEQCYELLMACGGMLTNQHQVQGFISGLLT